MKTTEIDDLLENIIEELKKHQPNKLDWDIVQDLLKNNNVSIEKILIKLLVASRYNVDVELFKFPTNK